MGQAKQRGTFEERKEAAIARNAAKAERLQQMLTEMKSRQESKAVDGSVAESIASLNESLESVGVK